MNSTFSGMTNFEIAQKQVQKWEGGLTDDKYDRGGITNYGVCIEFLKDVAQRKKKIVADLGIELPITRNSIRNLT